MRFRPSVVLGLCFVSTLFGQALRRPLAINESRYRVVAGGRITLEAPGESVEFMRSAITRTGRASDRTFPVAPDVAGDGVLVGVPLTTPPGEYSVRISAINNSGEERAAEISLTVAPLPNVPVNATTPPVVLLDGWQFSVFPPSSCPMSSDSSGTFGNLANYLTGSPNSVPVVYFFENCTECPNCSIEQLGADLGTLLNSILYNNGTPVPEVDVIAHSMGGLIVRAYLAGKQQTSGAFSPPSTQKIRKSVFVAAPHFGSYQADSLLADIFFAAGNQTNEMKRGSQFLWDLATWNQFGDDLRGTDALAIIGNAASFNNLPGTSDGIVGLTSGSLDFSRPGRTRIVDYCHVNPGSADGLAGFYTSCNQPGIAYIDTPSHKTYQTVSSFLLNTASWQSVGTAPAQDPNLSKDGGMVVADVNSQNQFTSGLSNVSWGSVKLTNGAASGELFYNDFVMNGSATFNFGSSTCGPYTQPPGVYSAARCKATPSVNSVGPLFPGVGKVVPAGTTITISGVGFGAQQCATCRVTASNPQPTVLQVSSWSDTSIQAFLPSTFAGLVQIGVTSTNGVDAINIMTALASLVVAPSSLQFAYTVGGTPAAQFIQITNPGSGTLTWSATSSATWLSVASQSGTAPSMLAVLVSPAGLDPGTYTGSVQISATGVANSPVTVAVTLTVSPAPVLAVSPQALTFNYTVGGAIPPAQGISITNTGSGSGPWVASSTAVWIGLSPASGTTPATLSVSVNPATLAAGSYSAVVLISPAGASGSPVSVLVTLEIQSLPTVVSIAGVSNGASFQPGFASATWITIFGANLAQTTRAWQASDFVNNLLPTSLNGVSVTINGLAAYVGYISPTQVNVLAPDDPTLGPIQVQVTSPLGKSNTFGAQKQPFSPAFFTYGGNYVAAQHADYTPVGNLGTPAKPGETILIYGTGFGPTNPPIPSGYLVTAPAVLANSVQITIGGQAASVAYAGLVDAGLYQFNVVVPNIPNGDATVQAQIGGLQTQTGALITVQQ